MPTQKPEQLTQQLETFLRHAITDLHIEPADTRGQPRILPALALWAGILVSVARGFNSQLELWRLLTSQGLWHFPRFNLTNDAIYKRLKNPPRDTLKTVFEQVTLLLNLQFSQPVQPLAAFAAGVFALDETSLDRVRKCLPSLRNQTKAVLPGK